MNMTNTRTGRVETKSGGFGFLVCDDGKKDWFLPQNSLNSAMNGDTVLAKLNAGSDRAEVVDIINRATTRIVGTFVRTRSGAKVVPIDKKLPEVLVKAGTKKLTAKDGQRVVALITKYGDPLEGNIIEVLGNEGDLSTAVLSVVRSFGFYDEFSKASLNEARHISYDIDQSELERRTDFREQLVVTIDGEDAKDLDDAVSLEALDGSYFLSVHIADVAHFVKPNSALDLDAFNKATSVYFADRVFPMLPKELSNGVCSLHSGQPKLTLSLTMEIDRTGKVVNSKLCEGIIDTAYRMSYNEVQQILDGDIKTQQKFQTVVPMLKDMQRLAQILSKKRAREGSVDFDLNECKIIIEDNSVKDVVLNERPFSHRLIEEFMLIANKTVAKKFLQMEVPFVYRIHEAPSPEKIEALNEFIAPFGLSLNLKNKEEGAKPADIANLLNRVKDLPCKEAVTRATLRSMQKAKYSEACLGHFGLSFLHYCHFTSPIRRYPDLAIHRIIKQVLHKGSESVQKFADFVVETAKLSSLKERAAEEAEREVDNLLKVIYMSEHIGKDFEGVISGVTDFGVFVELPNTIEGLVRAENLPKDSYLFDESTMCIKGRKNIFKFGDKIKVTLIKADVELRKLEFTISQN